jgi:hypothetical protein
MLKRMHFQEIGGLIPEDRRERILSVSRDNFLARINEREEPKQEEATPDETDANSTASERDELPDRKIGPEDLERDAVLEKAIEFLSQVKLEKQAA